MNESRPLRPRALRSIGHRTYVTLMQIELTGHEGRENSIDCEVEFWGDQTVGYEISSVQPYELQNRRGTERFLLDCPEWLEDCLAACVDTDRLAARELCP